MYVRQTKRELSTELQNFTRQNSYDKKAPLLNATGAKDIPLKSTGSEKVRVSVCLTANHV